jgi:Pyridoxamine 5'-phosphate oxidase
MVQLPERVRGLFDGKNFAVLSTLEPDGKPHSTVVWVKRLYATKRGWRPLIRATGGVCHWTPQWSRSRRR